MWLKTCPTASISRRRVLVKPPCLTLRLDGVKTLPVTWVVQEGFHCSRNMMLLLLNPIAFRHSTCCPFPRSYQLVPGRAVGSVLVPGCGYREGAPSREGVSMLQLLVQCQHTNQYCLWFLRKIMVLCSFWGRKPVEVEFWSLERVRGSFSGIKEQESTGPGGGTAFVGTMVPCVTRQF